jgi:transcription termination factor NusB
VDLILNAMSSSCNQVQLNKKSIARIAAIQTFYQFVDKTSNLKIDTLLTQVINFYKDKDIKSYYDIENSTKLKLRPSYSYLTKLITCTHKNLKFIDGIIDCCLTDKSTRMNLLPDLLFSILRVGICEIEFFSNVPKEVIISEYTDIASEMLDVRNIGLVNSILDKCAIGRTS